MTLWVRSARTCRRHPWHPRGVRRRARPPVPPPRGTRTGFRSVNSPMTHGVSGAASSWITSTGSCGCARSGGGTEWTALPGDVRPMDVRKQEACCGHGWPAPTPVVAVSCCDGLTAGLEGVCQWGVLQWSAVSAVSADARSTGEGVQPVRKRGAGRWRGSSRSASRPTRPSGWCCAICGSTRRTVARRRQLRAAVRAGAAGVRGGSGDHRRSRRVPRGHQGCARAHPGAGRALVSAGRAVRQPGAQDPQSCARCRGPARPVPGRGGRLGSVWCEGLVILPFPGATLQDPDGRDEPSTYHLDDLVPFLLRHRPPRNRPGDDISALREDIARVFQAETRPPSGPRRFGHYEVVETLHEADTAELSDGDDDPARRVSVVPRAARRPAPVGDVSPPGARRGPFTAAGPSVHRVRAHHQSGPCARQASALPEHRPVCHVPPARRGRGYAVVLKDVPAEALRVKLDARGTGRARRRRQAAHRGRRAQCARRRSCAPGGAPLPQPGHRPGRAQRHRHAHRLRLRPPRAASPARAHQGHGGVHPPAARLPRTGNATGSPVPSLPPPTCTAPAGVLFHELLHRRGAVWGRRRNTTRQP